MNPSQRMRTENLELLRLCRGGERLAHDLSQLMKAGLSTMAGVKLLRILKDAEAADPPVKVGP